MTRLRFRSKKMVKVYRERRKLVKRLLEERYWCARCWVQWSWMERSTEIHELLSRARGGDILDETNLVALCSPCHLWVTTHPQQATAEGWLRKRPPGNIKVGG